ncbi:MAG TPA: hypothetical protein VGW78_03905 [Candidatus Babeliales bacterium]|nr:hypothetical protein [Candidatus Babeliales bacterium]
MKNFKLIMFILCMYNTENLCMHHIKSYVYHWLALDDTYFDQNHKKIHNEVLTREIHNLGEYNFAYTNVIDAQERVRSKIYIQSKKYNQMNFFQRNFTSKGWDLASSILKNRKKLHKGQCLHNDIIAFGKKYQVEPANQSR